jgi:hypothetical protein
MGTSVRPQQQQQLTFPSVETVNGASHIVKEGHSIHRFAFRRIDRPLNQLSRRFTTPLLIAYRFDSQVGQFGIRRNRRDVEVPK